MRPLNIPRHEMPVRNAEKRIKDFGEVALGFGTADAVEEAQRCLQCKKPFCMDGCPVHVDIRDFIAEVAKENFAEAARIIKTKNNLPAVCGRVCPQESQCEQSCILNRKGTPVSIGALERFVADWEAENVSGEKSRKTGTGPVKVAVIGSGPSGLACAGDLAKKGYAVTVFEALHSPGGVLRYGIPEFRLPKDIVDREIEYITGLGVEIRTDVVAGQLFSIDELRSKGFEAVFIGTGAGLPYFLGIQGENLNGVYSANEFLTRVNLMGAYRFPEFATPVKTGRKVIVVGAGNVAMDAARTSLRLGAEEVYVVYRRTKEEMPARREEIHHAEEEGVKIMELASPVEFRGDENGNLVSAVCQVYELGEKDESGRRRPVPVEGQTKTIEADTAVIAVGQGPNPLLTAGEEHLETNRKGNIIAGDDGATSMEGVFAGGDIVTGAATVILAMGAGKTAAESIDTYLKNKDN